MVGATGGGDGVVPVAGPEGSNVIDCTSAGQIRISCPLTWITTLVAVASLTVPTMRCPFVSSMTSARAARDGASSHTIASPAIARRPAPTPRSGHDGARPGPGSKREALIWIS
jgi:hypothetical protein